jgi:FdhD protein
VSGRAAEEALREGTRPVARTRFEAGRAEESPDAVAHEEPLEIRLGAAPLAVVMRTPGHDVELVTGFLLTERIVASLGDVVSVHHASEVPSPEGEDNVVRVVLAPGVAVDLEALRRNLFASSSCGVCGKASLENALAVAPPLDDETRFDAETVCALPERLRAAQPLFARTGGLHAAALFDAAGRLLAAREDVGRHNAVDKVVGFAARAGRLPLRGHALMVSGRISFEIVQKALAARIPLVAAVGAPSSLAVRLAGASGIAAVGFVRGPSLSVYGHRARVVL